MLKEFGERLQALRQQRETERSVQEKKTRDEQLALAEAERLAREKSEKSKREAARRTELLEKELEETFKPILETVNESYLENKGQLEGRASSSSIIVELSWISGIPSSISGSGVRHNLIKIEKNTDEVSLGYGEDRYKVETKEKFELQDENWKEQLLGSIEAALIEGKCGYWVYPSRKEDMSGVFGSY